MQEENEITKELEKYKHLELSTEQIEANIVQASKDKVLNKVSEETVIVRNSRIFIIKRHDILYLFKNLGCINTERVFDNLLDKLYQKELIDYEKFYFLYAEEYSRLLNIRIDNAYALLKNVSSMLIQALVTGTDETSTVHYASRIVEEVQFDEVAKAIAIKFTSFGAAAVSGYQQPGTYTSFLTSTSRTKSHTRYLLMTYLQEHAWKGTITIEADELRRLLGIEGSYPNMNDLKKRVLEPTMKDIEDLTLYVAKFEVQKKGKSLRYIVFTIGLKDYNKNFKDGTKVRTFSDAVKFTSISM